MTLKPSNFKNKFMQLALAEAQIAYDIGEVPVGCIIVNRESGQIIAKTHNLMQSKKNPNYHAEILAINLACETIGSKALLDCDIYVTLEPCTMCASAISNARLSRLYYGASDLKQGAVENGVKFYTHNSCMYRPEIYSGINAEESTLLITNFFGKLRKSKLC
jgi:cytosine deaminase